MSFTAAHRNRKSHKRVKPKSEIKVVTKKQHEGLENRLHARQRARRVISGCSDRKVTPASRWTARRLQSALHSPRAPTTTSPRALLQSPHPSSKQWELCGHGAHLSRGRRVRHPSWRRWHIFTMRQSIQRWQRNRLLSMPGSGGTMSWCGRGWKGSRGSITWGDSPCGPYGRTFRSAALWQLCHRIYSTLSTWRRERSYCIQSEHISRLARCRAVCVVCVSPRLLTSVARHRLFSFLCRVLSLIDASSTYRRFCVRLCENAIRAHTLRDTHTDR
jgi:hypothetical protein